MRILSATAASGARRLEHAVSHRNWSSFPLTSSRTLELFNQDQVAGASSNGKLATRTRYFSTKAKKQAAAVPEGSYFERKQQAKELRTREYEIKVERVEKRKGRRDDAPKNVLRNEFRAWWNKRRAYQEMMERKARIAGLEWKIEVAVIVERTPVILPDKEDWETEFEELHAYLSQFGKEFPKEFVGETTTDEASTPPAFTDEDLWALLPEGFTPAPRETEADKSGDVRTLDRRLKDRIFLTVQDGEDSKWGLPTIVPKKDETLLDAAKRVVKDKVGGQLMDLYCASNAPVAVNFKVFTEEERKDGFFGVKTFFMRVQHDEGNVSKKDMQVKDFAWLDRSEVVARVQEEQGLRQSKLYRYML